MAGNEGLIGQPCALIVTIMSMDTLPPMEHVAATLKYANAG